MRRIALAIALAAAVVAVLGTALAHEGFNHPAPSFAPQAPLSTALNSGGTNAEWELVATIPTGNPHTDLDFFTRGGQTYASVGTLAAGPNAGGQSIVRLVDAQGKVAPEYVGAHPSASCLSTTTGATGLQHDAEAAPKGDVIFNSPNLHPDRRDAQLILDSTDATGRCHDQGAFGAQAPQGGIEIVDVTDPAHPRELALTSHVGQAHTVNVDPKRPHIAFDVTQDAVEVNEDGVRTNQVDGSTSNAMDGFEVLDLSSCMNFPAGTTLDQKKTACIPQVYRYRFPTAAMAASAEYPEHLESCHEVEIYPDDKLACAAINATLLFDLSGAFDDNGTPTDYSDDHPRGTPLPCRRRPSSTVAAFGTDAKVIDCVNGGTDASPQSLRVSEWVKIGSPSLAGVRHLGTIHHMGFRTGAAAEEAPNPKYNSKQDVFASHEAELTNSKRFLLVTDERGGGVVPGGATCSPGVDNEIGNGGIHAFPVRSLQTLLPPNGATAQQRQYARTSSGDRAIYRAATRTGPQASVCTSHVFQQIPGQNRIFMGWYSQGTQVVDFTENANGTIDFKEAGWFTPENADTWTSAIFKVQRNRDGTFTYWGATGDGILPGTGRSAIDVYKVTLPAPPTPAGPRQPGTPTFPTSDVRGVENTSTEPPCARKTAFERVDARPLRRGLQFSFSRRGDEPVHVELLEHALGRRIRRARRVKNFGDRSRAFSWGGSSRLRPGYYYAQFTTTTADGHTDVRRVGLRLAGGRFKTRPPFDVRGTCSLLGAFKLGRTVFGGSTGRALGIAFQLNEDAKVTVEVRRGRKLVKRFKARQYAAGRTGRLRLSARGLAVGDYRVTLKAERPGKVTQQTLVARRL